jgi:hypothetical protein
MVSYGEEFWSSSEKLLMAISSVGSQHARRVDRCVEKTFEARIVKDPGYALEKDSDFQIREIMKNLYSRKAESEELFQEAGTDFEQAGRGTRAVLQAILPPRF